MTRNYGNVSASVAADSPRKKMPSFNPNKLHVAFKDEIKPSAPLIPRCYTLTHSDITGDLFLTVARNFDLEALDNWQTRLMRDEVIGEWRKDFEEGPSLHLGCHVSGRGLTFGPAGLRYGIFQYHLPMVLQALRYGDRLLYEAQPDLDAATIFVYFKANQRRYNRIENWGYPAEYII